MAAPQVVNKLFDRHMKLAYDSFEGIRNLSPTDISTVMQRSFLSFKNSQKWSTSRLEYPNSHENIDSASGIYILSEKFHASKSRSLTSAIKDLEQRVKDDLEEQVEEEQSQSQNSQEDKKPSARNISTKSAGGRF